MGLDCPHHFALESCARRTVDGLRKIARLVEFAVLNHQIALQCSTLLSCSARVGIPSFVNRIKSPRDFIFSWETVGSVFLYILPIL